MRYHITLGFRLFSLFFLTACDDESPVSPSESVTIEGIPYSTIKIGNLTWTTSNYAGPGGVKYDESNSKPEYGKYYSKAELNSITLPAGWRIPTLEDYSALAQFYGITILNNGSNGEAIKALTSTTNWNHVQGTNASGFNAYPAGYIFSTSNPIDGDIAEFWTVEGKSLSIQEVGATITSLRIVFYESNNSPDYRFNVRFVKVQQ